MLNNNITATLTKHMPSIFLALLMATTILLLMDLPPSKTCCSHLDKVIHALLFLSLGFTGTIAFSTQKLWVYGGLILYGALTEVLQETLTAHRHASIYDWIADIVGILLCIVILTLFKKQFAK